jgi:hypothetical protein
VQGDDLEAALEAKLVRLQRLELAGRNQPASTAIEHASSLQIPSTGSTGIAHRFYRTLSDTSQPASTMSDPPVQIFPPDSDTAQLSVEQFPLDKFLGTWHVVWSTLPLWKVSQALPLRFIVVDDRCEWCIG